MRYHATARYGDRQRHWWNRRRDDIVSDVLVPFAGKQVKLSTRSGIAMQMRCARTWQRGIAGRWRGLHPNPTAAAGPRLAQRRAGRAGRGLRALLARAAMSPGPEPVARARGSTPAAGSADRIQPSGVPATGASGPEPVRANPVSILRAARVSGVTRGRAGAGGRCRRSPGGSASRSAPPGSAATRRRARGPIPSRPR